MLEDNLSKSPPHFLWETQKGASHFVTCKSHSSPTLIPRLFMCLCHNATSVWCLGIGDARVSPAHQPPSALRDETPFPESPSVYPGRVPSPVSSPGASSTLPTWGWPGRVTAHNWKSQFSGDWFRLSRVTAEVSTERQNTPQPIPAPRKQKAPFWDLPKQQNIIKSTHLTRGCRWMLQKHIYDSLESSAELQQAVGWT